MKRKLVWAVPIPTIVLAGCGDSDDTTTTTTTTVATATTPSSTTTTTTTTTATRPATTTAPAPTTRAVNVTAAMFASLGLAKDRLPAFFGATAFTQTRSDVNDAAVAYSSSADLSAFLKTQNASVNYNAWTASSACSVCAVQVVVMHFASSAVASTSYAKVKEVNEAIFKNVKSQTGFGAYWDSSFCQTGDFTSSAGQTTQWYFCSFSKGNLVVTTAVGGLNLNVQSVGDGLKSYATAVEAFLKSQFP